MTEQERDAEIGRAYREKRGVEENVACLEHRTRTTAKALLAYVDETPHCGSIDDALENAPNPVEAW